MYKNVYKNGDPINECIYIEEAGKKFGKNKKSIRISKFRCKCGNEFIASIDHVIDGSTSSCGCKLKNIGKWNIKHGLTNTKEYSTWANIKRRCNDSTNKKYEYYGGRGISICERWSEFENFISDMGFAPSKKHSIDRINNDGNYEPANCRWATTKEQSRNKSSNIQVFYKGEKRLLLDLIDDSLVSYRVLKIRIVKLKWDIEKALKTPFNSIRLGNKLNENEKVKIRQLFSTKEYSQRQLAKMFNSSEASISRILNKR